MKIFSILFSMLLLLNEGKEAKSPKGKKVVKKETKTHYQAAWGNRFFQPIMKVSNRSKLENAPIGIVRTMSGDKNQQIWFGSWDGIYRFDAEKSHSPCFEGKCVHNVEDNLQNEEHNALENKAFWAVSEAQKLGNQHIVASLADQAGNMWMAAWDEYGIQGGVYRFEAASLKNAMPKYIWFDEKNSPLKARATSFLEEKDGSIWMGTHRGLVKYETSKLGKKEAVFQAFHNPMGAKADSIFSLVQDKSGIIWMGTAKGLFLFQTSGAGKGDFRACSRENGKNLKEVKSLAMDQNGKIWLGSTEGLFFIETPTGKIQEAKCNTEIQQLTVWSLCVDKQNKLWMGLCDSIGYGAGLASFSQGSATGKSSHLTRWNTNKQGLTDQRIYSILEDENGKIWLGTSSGVFQYQSKTNTFRQFKGWFDGC